jgi:HK97 family phage major capsid protein
MTEAEIKAAAEKEAADKNIVTLDQVGKAVAEAVGAEMKKALDGLGEIIKAQKAPAIVQDLGEKRSLREIIAGLKMGSKRVVEKYKLISERDYFGEQKAGSEGTTTAGGFLVPTEEAGKLLTLIKEKSIIRNLATIWPMRNWKLTTPTVTNGVTAYWIDENALKTASDATFGQLALQAYKLCSISPVSDELLSDSNPAVDTVLYNLIALAMIRAEETAFAQGAAGVGDPITGIYNTAGITTIAASGNLLDDIADLIGAVEENEGENVTILHALREKRQIRKMKDDNGDYIYQKPADKNTPATIWDAAAIGDKYIPKTLGGTADESYMLAGDFSHAHIGDCQEVVIAVDTSRYFEYDQTVIRGVKRVGFKIDDATKFARITGIRPI